MTQVYKKSIFKETDILIPGKLYNAKRKKPSRLDSIFIPCFFPNPSSEKEYKWNTENCVFYNEKDLNNLLFLSSISITENLKSNSLKRTLEINTFLMKNKIIGIENIWNFILLN